VDEAQGRHDDRPQPHHRRLPRRVEHRDALELTVARELRNAVEVVDVVAAEGSAQGVKDVGELLAYVLTFSRFTSM
jgi:hypothetical protein